MNSSYYYIPVGSRICLCCLTCHVDPSEIRDASAKSFFHWKTLKCRLIINEIQMKVVACPLSESEGSFSIVTTKDFFKTGELTKTLKKLNLTFNLQQSVDSKIYSDCVKYTMEFYLSPKWNKVNGIYMKGQNFLTNSDFNDAVIIDINLVSQESSSKDEIEIKLTPITAKLVPLRLEQLTSSTQIDKFFKDPNGVLDGSSFRAPRVKVLPSMKSAVISRVLKKIPPTSPFKNYSEFRRHWKNMYGYRLPKFDDTLTYYEIYFSIANMPRKYLIYPDFCVKNEKIQCPSENSEILKKEFLQDLHNFMPKILDKLLEIFEKSQQDPYKYENSENLIGFSTPIRENCIDNLEFTTRLSFSGYEPLAEKQLTTQMSPTPSLKGKEPELKKKMNKDLEKTEEIHIPSGSNYSRGSLEIFQIEPETSSYFENSKKTQKRVLTTIFTQNKRKKQASFEKSKKIGKEQRP